LLDRLCIFEDTTSPGLTIRGVIDLSNDQGLEFWRYFIYTHHLQRLASGTEMMMMMNDTQLREKSTMVMKDFKAKNYKTITAITDLHNASS